MKKIIIALIFAFLTADRCPLNAEEVEITTYYPAPEGVYGELASKVYYDYDDPAYQAGSADYFLDPYPPTEDPRSLTVAGRIGIGTADPGVPLDVHGQISSGTIHPAVPTSGRIEVSGPGGEFSLLDRQQSTSYPGGEFSLLDRQSTSYNSADRWVIYHDSDALRFYRVNDKVIFDSSGNVGIGTTSPNAALQVNGAISRQQTVLYGTAAATHVNLGVNSLTGIDGSDVAYCTVSGGLANWATGSYATVGGGAAHQATAYSSTVSGGWENHATADYSTISGGRENEASGLYSTISGGFSHIASGAYATVCGGYNNSAYSIYSTVSGGNSNTASGGVGYATVCGGNVNTAINGYSTVSGGKSNTASGLYSTVSGGYNNTASGDYSFAAGRDARAQHVGSFVWVDSSGSTCTSFGNKTFTVRAAGGTRFYSNSNETAGVSLVAGGSSWSSVSDRNLKENFKDEDGEKVLMAIAKMPIQSWNYKSQDKSIRHLGPVAQDFYAAFKLGENDTTISTVDIDGINMLAIQALEKRTAELNNIKAELEDLKKKIIQLEDKVK